jgi:long-chain acyl-CoA synthetase
LSAAGGPTTLVDLFAATLDAHAGRPLFVTKAGGRWSETSYADFAKQVDALRAALSELDVSAGDRGYEPIQAFTLLTQDFTQENRMLTPSLKLRRRNAIERFRSELLGLYAE